MESPEHSRHRIFHVFKNICRKNNLSHFDYYGFVRVLTGVGRNRFTPKGDHRHRILEVFEIIYERNNFPENDYKIFAEKLMGVPALNFPGLDDRTWRRFCAAKAFKKRRIVPEPTDSDEESEPRSISPEPREAGDPHVIDLTSEA